MFTTRRINLNGNFSSISLSQLLPSIRISNFEESQFQFSSYIRRRIQEREDEAVLVEDENNSNENPNFMKEKDINFRLYPFYINWKKLETNESDYYHIFIHFGYFGASIYSLFKEKLSIITVKNIIYVFSTFIYDRLLAKDNKEESGKKIINNFFEKLPNYDELYQLIKKKIIMMKEVPIILIILKIFEIYFLIQKNYKEIEKILKSEYLLGTYLTNEEYDEIYNNHFKGKVSKIFIKIEDENGKAYSLPKNKEKLFNHIRYIYRKFIK